MSRTRIEIALLIVIFCVVSLGAVTTYVVWHHAPVPDVVGRAIMEDMYILGQRQRVHLLYKTNHQALLAACRKVSKKVTNGDMKNGPYRLRSGPDRWFAGFSRPILNLRPNRVYINFDGRVKLEMAGGLDHFGVYAYPEGYKLQLHTEKLGDKKLLDGLWYYDDGYRVRPEDYDKRIEALRPKGK
jgi:hypothetical protein